MYASVLTEVRSSIYASVLTEPFFALGLFSIRKKSSKLTGLNNVTIVR